MENQFSRTELLIGAEGTARLKASRVAVFGIGGVGGYVMEALARSGVGTLDLIDNDRVCLTNLNRQIIATHSTIGEYKVDAARKRVLDINPEAVVHTYKTFFMPETASEFNFYAFDYVVDAIDTVTGKIQLVMQADRAHTPIISSMGAGNKMNPAAFKVADIYQTRVCPLAKVMRRELKKRGISGLKVVYSEEVPIGTHSEEEVLEIAGENDTGKTRKRTPGSNAFVPAAAGLIIAGEVVKDLLQYKV
ncbi:MAG: tRNA threonylcarbamoyladenosine dehydratase [Lachnospiraceae bacterium]